jgi:hypothetical protein
LELGHIGRRILRREILLLAHEVVKNRESSVTSRNCDDFVFKLKTFIIFYMEFNLIWWFIKE